jgi:hypothetical protein
MARPAVGSVTRLAIALTALVLSLLAPSTAAAAVRSEFFGIVQGPTLDTRDLNNMQAARVRTDRFLLNWEWVQPTAGPPSWAATDRLIGRLAVHGIRALPSVWGNPDWVSGGDARPPLDSSASVTAWQNLLKALAARYGSGGSYWTTRYRQQYGTSATPLPVQSWQVWNEPNLKKFYVPYPAPKQYARLVKISHGAIRSRDPHAQIVLAGMPGYGDVKAWDFLKEFYSVAGIKNYFDAVALHPYATDLAHVRLEIQNVRGVMTNHADGSTPLWITELAWGSAPPDRFGINKGPTGQANMLRDSYRMILQNRTAWNVQRLFWYLWRDPRPSPGTYCSFCDSAGLVKYNRNTQPPIDNFKPAYFRFKEFVSETTKPQASITGGPAQGGFTKDSTPTLSFASNEPGSTFVCRVDAGAFKPCRSPYTTPPLADGNHTFFVQAIDAPGNESQYNFRYFTVDTQPPAAPQITDTDPNSPANDNAPEVKGSAAAGSIVRLFKTAGCTGTPVAIGSAAKFASPGITASVTDNTTTAFRARATDAAGNASPCSAAFTYVEDSTP